MSTPNKLFSPSNNLRIMFWILIELGVDIKVDDVLNWARKAQAYRQLLP